MIFNILGNPIDGYNLIGPYPDRFAAVEDQERIDESVWIIESVLPTAPGIVSSKDYEIDRRTGHTTTDELYDAILTAIAETGANPIETLQAMARVRHDIVRKEVKPALQAGARAIPTPQKGG